MIIWSGWGILGLVIPIVFGFAATALCNAVYGHNYTAIHTWPLGVSTLVSAGVLYVLALRLNGPGRTLVDPQTGQTLVLRRRHSLFFIPLQWIAAIVAVIGLYLLVAPARGSSVAPSSTTIWVEACRSPIRVGAGRVTAAQGSL